MSPRSRSVLGISPPSPRLRRHEASRAPLDGWGAAGTAGTGAATRGQRTQAGAINLRGAVAGGAPGRSGDNGKERAGGGMAPFWTRAGALGTVAGNRPRRRERCPSWIAPGALGASPALETLGRSQKSSNGSQGSLHAEVPPKGCAANIFTPLSAMRGPVGTISLPCAPRGFGVVFGPEPPTAGRWLAQPYLPWSLRRRNPQRRAHHRGRRNVRHRVRRLCASRTNGSSHPRPQLGGLRARIRRP